MCKANDIYIPVLVGDERGEIVHEQREEAVEDPELLNQVDEEDEGCDVITWVMIATSILLLVATAFMPCGCEVVHVIEGQGSAVLRGAAKLFHPEPQEPHKDTTDFQLRPSELEPLVVDGSVSNGSIEEDSLESSENTSQDEEEFHVYSGLPNDESASGDDFVTDDHFAFEMVQESEADDDELTDQDEESVERTSVAHKRPVLEKNDKQTIFSSEMVKHVFVSQSSQSRNADGLLESREASPSRTKDSTSHSIPSQDDDSANAKQSSDESPKSYSVSYDEVFMAAPSDDDEGIVLEEKVLKRRSLGDATN